MFHLSRQMNKLEITQKSWYIVHEYFMFVCPACECGNEPSGSMKYGEFLD